MVWGDGLKQMIMIRVKKEADKKISFFIIDGFKFFNRYQKHGVPAGYTYGSGLMSSAIGRAPG